MVPDDLMSLIGLFAIHSHYKVVIKMAQVGVGRSNTSDQYRADLDLFCRIGCLTNGAVPNSILCITRDCYCHAIEMSDYYRNPINLFIHYIQSLPNILDGFI